MPPALLTNTSSRVLALELLRQRADLFLRRQIRQHILDGSFAGLLFDPRDRRRALVRVAPNDDHRGAARRELLRRFRANAGRRAGDHADFAVHCTICYFAFFLRVQKSSVDSKLQANA
jgi:hypothetical protein